PDSIFPSGSHNVTQFAMNLASSISSSESQIPEYSSPTLITPINSTCLPCSYFSDETSSDGSIGAPYLPSYLEMSLIAHPANKATTRNHDQPQTLSLIEHSLPFVQNIFKVIYFVLSKFSIHHPHLQPPIDDLVHRHTI